MLFFFFSGGPASVSLSNATNHVWQLRKGSVKWMNMLYEPILHKSFRPFIRHVFLNAASTQGKTGLEAGSTLGEIMALDVGTRYTGVAVSMKNCTYPRSIDTIRHHGKKSLCDSTDKIVNLMEAHNVKSLVVGWPLDYEEMEPEGKQCRFVLRSILQLCKTNVKFHKIPILLQDETNSTKDVIDSGIQSIFGRNVKEKGVVDQMVAINLLNSVLVDVQEELHRDYMP